MNIIEISVQERGPIAVKMLTECKMIHALYIGQETGLCSTATGISLGCFSLPINPNILGYGTGCEKYMMPCIVVDWVLCVVSGDFGSIIDQDRFQIPIRIYENLEISVIIITLGTT